MNLGMPEMIFIFLLALLIFGPRKLPEVGRQIGKALAEFKRASNEFKAQLETEMRNLELEEAAKKQQAAAPATVPPERSIAAGTMTPPEDQAASAKGFDA
jgi:TatA/E family protein of Tat protein translocase